MVRRKPASTGKGDQNSLMNSKYGTTERKNISQSQNPIHPISLISYTKYQTTSNKLEPKFIVIKRRITKI